MSKRVKHTESGAYTSSTQDSEEVEPRERPEGQKKGKDRLKGKEKKCTTEHNLETLKTEKMRLYYEVVQKKAEAMKLAAQSIEKTAKENTKKDLLSKYLDLMVVDTSGYDDTRLQHHKSLVKYMEMKLFYDLYLVSL